MTQTLLITGAAGEIGSMLRHALARPGRRLRLLDIADQEPVTPDEDAEIITASLTDVDAMLQAADGADAIIHLASLLDGYTWQQYLDVNLHGTYVTLEAARRAKVPRVIYASSHHAVGFTRKTPGAVAPDYMFPRPDSFYGVCKIASEALGSLYHDRHGLDVVCIRIASYRPEPNDRRALWNWLSPGDTTRLIEAAITTPSPGFRVVWGVSDNDQRWMSLDEAEKIGYVSQNNAENWAETVYAATKEDDPKAAYDRYLGGLFARPDFDESARTR